MNKKIIKGDFIRAAVISLCVIIIGLILPTLLSDYSYGSYYETHSMMRLDAIKTLICFLSGVVTFWGYFIWKELKLVNARSNNEE